MNARVFPTMREAIHHAATRSGRSMKEIAAELDWSPTALSLTTTLGEDNARPFPADDAHLIKLQLLTGDYSPLATMADKLGYELVPKRDRTAEIAVELKREVVALGGKVEQLLLGLDHGSGAKKR